MSLYQLSPLDLPKLREKTEKHIAKLRKHQELIAVITAVIQKFDCKIINKRLETAVKKALDEKFVVNLEHIAGMNYLNIWGNGIEYNDKLRLFMVYDSAPVLDFAQWQKDKSPAEGFKQSIAESTKALESIEANVKRYNAALAEINAADDALKGLATWKD